MPRESTHRARHRRHEHGEAALLDHLHLKDDAPRMPAGGGEHGEVEAVWAGRDVHQRDEACADLLRAERPRAVIEAEDEPTRA